MPQIKGTEWYTAAALKGTPIEGSERCAIKMLYGYRRPMAGLPKAEIEKQIKFLADQGITAKEKVSLHNHTDIPAGTPYLEVLDPLSVARLETALAKKGIEFPSDRFDVYTKPVNPVKRKFVLHSKRSH